MGEKVRNETEKVGEKVKKFIEVDKKGKKDKFL